MHPSGAAKKPKTKSIIRHSKMVLNHLFINVKFVREELIELKPLTTAKCKKLHK